MLTRINLDRRMPPRPFALALLAALLPVSSLLAADASKSLAYPKPAKGDVIDVFHGTKVPDPYRALEDPDTPESRAWIEAENKITFGFLESIPERSAIRDRLTQVWDYERFGLPNKRGGRYFFTKNDGLQNQSVLYWTPKLETEPKVLLDPNKLSADGTVALTGTAVSEDGRLLAFGLATAGSDWQEWKVRDVETGNELSEQVKWVKFSGASWTHDGKGFFYSRYDEPKPGEELQQANYFQKLFYHKLGTPQAEDILVYHRPDQKEWGFQGGVTEDGKYLAINVWKGTDTKNLFFYQELGDKDRNTVELIKKFEADFDFIENVGYTFLFRTDLDAPRYRVIAIDIRKPERANWKEIIPQSEHVLQSAGLVGGKLITSYLKHATTLVKVYEPDGKFVRDVELPGLGSAFGFGGRKDDPETFFMFTSFTDPGTIFRYDVSTGDKKIHRRPKVAFKPEDFQTRQEFYVSKDGTKIPIFITSRNKTLSLNGDNPTLLYGYGGFNASITPTFSPRYIPWMEMGGVYAVANLRGGGEYGKDWHEAGMKLKKQNVFDDFIAAAEFLIKRGITKPENLAIMGGSNGGLLVGACMNQRPDLFGAVVPIVGVLDMLRFHKFTIGHAWVSDYGSPENAEEFKALYAYSPYHNLKPSTDYPATLILTGDHDDRVVPAHSFKFAARLQEMHTGKDPVLIRIQTKAGHGAGKPTSMQIEEAADIWAFLVKTLNMKVDPSSALAPKKDVKKDSAG